MRAMATKNVSTLVFLHQIIVFCVQWVCCSECSERKGRREKEQRIYSSLGGLGGRDMLLRSGAGASSSSGEYLDTNCNLKFTSD
jgi:hypothetical protein